MSEPEIRELLAWISERPRSYSETIEVWKSSCPRHSSWEDVLEEEARSGRAERLGVAGRADGAWRVGARDRLVTDCY
jgi:hypothetical protein